MEEGFQGWYWIAFMVIAFVFGQLGIQFRMKRAADFILRELSSKGAFAPESAVPLPYSKAALINLGMRDMKPKMLEFLITHGIVGRTQDGRFYLPKRDSQEEVLVRKVEGG
ncbi:MAG: hypothetical protein ACK4WB_05960 [Desulfatiglandales bacterium]